MRSLCNPTVLARVTVDADVILRSLLKDQRVHDERVHRDIYYLSYPRRLTHLVLHLSKYVGRLTTPIDRRDNIRRTIVDTFIIALSASELLRINIAEELTGHLNPTPRDLTLLASQGVPKLSPLVEAGEWFFEELARQTGLCAKSLESLDHLEEHDYRRQLENSITCIVKACLVTTAQIGLDLDQSVRSRWLEFESAALKGGLEEV